MIAGIVLAAGMSTRMGAFKQLLPLAGRPVIQWVVELIVPRVARVVVVLGHRAEEVKEALGGYPVEAVFNPDFAAGMLTSVQCGIRAADQAEAYLICLGDQPGVSPAAVEAVLKGAAAGGAGIVIPVNQGRRGHPILIRRSYREEILGLPRDQGLHLVTRGYPEDTLEIPVDDDQVLKDLDTPADYQKARARFPPSRR